MRSRIWPATVEFLCQHSLPQCYTVPSSLSSKICKTQPIPVQYEKMHSFLDACCSLKLCKNHIFKNVNPPNSCVLLLTGEVMRIKTVPTSRLSWDSFHLIYDAYGCSLVAKSSLTLCDPMYCSPPGSSVYGILQARILEWVAIPSSRESSRPREQTRFLLWQADSLPLSHQGSSWCILGAIINHLCVRDNGYLDRCSTDVFINEQAYELINEWKYVLDIVSPSY